MLPIVNGAATNYYNKLSSKGMYVLKRKQCPTHGANMDGC
jgi:hypothetical protein